MKNVVLTSAGSKFSVKSYNLVKRCCSCCSVIYINIEFVIFVKYLISKLYSGLCIFHSLFI